MITKIKQVLQDTWLFFVAAGITLTILLTIADVSSKHAEYRYRVEYTHGRHAMTYYVDSIVTTESSVSFIDEDDDLVEVKGAYLIIKQH
jgi:hypothetical protein